MLLLLKYLKLIKGKFETPSHFGGGVQKNLSGSLEFPFLFISPTVSEPSEKVSGDAISLKLEPTLALDFEARLV